MANDLLLKGVALAIFVAATSGAAVGVKMFIERGLDVEPVEDALRVAPGSTVSLALVVRNGDADAAPVSLAVTGAGGLVPGAPAGLTVPASGRAGAWLTLDVPADAAPGRREVVVTAEAEGGKARRATTSVTIEVLAPGEGLKEGEAAQVSYVGRLADGRMFNANLRRYIDAPLPRTDYYRDSGEFTVQTGEEANVIPGFWQGLVGMRPGESRTLVLTPDEAYGPKVVEEVTPRRVVLERTYEMRVRPVSVPFQSFASHVTATGQGDPEDFGLNSTFELVQDGNRWTFRLTNLTQTTVTYVPAPRVGERFTLPQHRAWANASVVQSVNDSAIVFHTTPTTAVGEAFTYRAQWPQASVVESANETHVVVRHDPPVGLEFNVTVQGAGERSYRILAVGEDEITQGFDSPNPLAGETLVFLVRLERVVADDSA